MSADDPDAWARAWLGGFSFQRFGVSLEQDVDQIAGMLDPETIAKIRRVADPGNELAAVTAVIRAPGFLAMTNGTKNRVRRVRGALRAIRNGFALPPPAAERAYDPVPGRILYVVHMRGPFEQNGYVSRTELVLKAMTAAGYDPEPVTRFGFPTDILRHRTAGAAMADEETVGGRLWRGRQDPKGGQNARPVDEYLTSYADWLVEVAKERRPAAICAASNNLNGLAAILAARRLGAPAIYEVRGMWEVTQASLDEVYARSLRYTLQRRLEIETVRAADRVVTNSAPLRQFVIDDGAAPERVFVAENGVDAGVLTPRPCDEVLKASLGIGVDDVVIGYAGSVVRYEGLDLLIEALALLKARGVRNVRFLLIGDGAELDGLKARAAALEVEHACVFLGRVARERIEGLYSIIDVAPFPRRSLAVTELVTPLKPFEAMAAAKAVVVSSAAALASTVIDGRTGLVAEKDDVADLAAKLERLIRDPTLRARLGREARDWVARERSVAAMARDWTAALAGLVAPRR